MPVVFATYELWVVRSTQRTSFNSIEQSAPMTSFLSKTEPRQVEANDEDLDSVYTDVFEIQEMVVAILSYCAIWRVVFIFSHLRPSKAMELCLVSKHFAHYAESDDLWRFELTLPPRPPPSQCLNAEFIMRSIEENCLRILVLFPYSSLAISSYCQTIALDTQEDGRGGFSLTQRSILEFLGIVAITRFVSCFFERFLTLKDLCAHSFARRRNKSFAVYSWCILG